MKKLFILIFLVSLILPSFVFAQGVSVQDQLFEAKVIEIMDENIVTREDGSEFVQQNLKLIGLEGRWEDQEVIYEGINDLDLIKSVTAKKGDKVVLTASTNVDREEVYYVTDHVRRGWLYFLALLFAVLIIVVGKGKGVKALISLVVTFLIIMWFIIPLIMAGHSPLLVSIIGSVAILGAIVYITWGIKRKAHIAVVSIAISLVITGILSIIFTKLTALSGLAQDDAMFLVGAGGIAINFQGLLLAGIIIGTLGVLDDVVISQISTIEQIKLASHHLTHYELFKRGIKVGVDHISSMTNTLFLAYAGASLPLLLLFSTRSDSSVSLSQVLNNEVIATEIVRTLTGSIGLILAVPIATVIAAHFLVKVKKKKS